MRTVSGRVGVLMVLVAGLLCAAAAEVLPFSVSIGGKSAAMTPDHDSFATLPGPVSHDATIAIGGASGTVIINAFPCDAQGNPVDGAQPSVIILHGKSAGKLSDTMNKKRLAAGTYIANVVSKGRTARVFFKVR